MVIDTKVKAPAMPIRTMRRSIRSERRPSGHCKIIPPRTTMVMKLPILNVSSPFNRPYVGAMPQKTPLVTPETSVPTRATGDTL